MTFRRFLSRDEIGLRKPDSRSRNIDPASGGLARHYAGSAQGVRLDLSGHDRCLDLWRGYQSHHMDTNGWVDIAYTGGCCQHGFALAGRGALVRTAAQGTDYGNDHFYAIQWIGGGNEKPTQHAIDAFYWWRDRLMDIGNAGDKVRDHSDFKATGCPGNFTFDIEEQTMPEKPSDWAADAWQWGMDIGLLSDESEPHADVPKQEMVILLQRFEDHLDGRYAKKSHGEHGGTGGVSRAEYDAHDHETGGPR